ncbi:unnamed protein product [Eruca vesicaria subsp. sativa]|uniref:Uncharacterized protein n=1 Tax=Eruca vesicaria subsp. sativa TaxID=29727 RepID=A0ABC8J8M5_ERUVS|nr:unnamed protein product [Eruca vesicaria subsp. sativa]
MHRVLLFMALITLVVSRSEEEQCRDMFESFIEGMSLQPSPQYCRGVSHLNNVLKLTSPIASLEKKKRKGKVGIKPCECMESEVTWKLKCVRCDQDPSTNVF